MRIATAYCWANGLIEIGTHCPEGALPIGAWEEEELTAAIQALANSGLHGGFFLPKNEAWMQAVVAKDELTVSALNVDLLLEFRKRVQKAIRAGTFTNTLQENSNKGVNAAPLHDPIRAAVDLIEQYGMIDGGHHKQWLLDRVIFTLLGQQGYDEWLNEYDSESDVYQQWDTGIAP